MKSKACFKCHQVKPLKLFYKHQWMGDGHLGKCIECAKSDVASRLAIKKKDPKWVRIERDRCRRKQARYRELGIAKKTTPRARRRWMLKNPEKLHASRAANNALRDGRIKRRAECQKCGTTGVRLEKHHSNYSKPLKVTWLYSPCHGLTRRL